VAESDMRDASELVESIGDGLNVDGQVFCAEPTDTVPRGGRDEKPEAKRIASPATKA
jgi:hypothetical protein